MRASRVLTEARRSSRQCSLALVAAVLLIGVAVESSSSDAEIGDLVKRRAEAPMLRRVERPELAKAELLFHSILSQGWSAQVSRLCAELDLNIMRVQQHGEGFLVVEEDESRREGRGLFVFRSTATEPVFLQAPHAFFDLRTDEVATRMFLRTRCAVAAWNTCRRDARVVGSQRVADLCRLDATYWQALTRAFARAYRRGTVVQLHGFSPSQRSTVEAKQYELILSRGTRSGHEDLLGVKACFGEKVRLRTAVFPVDVEELGGTRNVQGRLLRSVGTGFVHVEMSPNARKRLITDDALLECFARCLMEVAR